MRPSIRKFLNCNPLLTSGTLVKEWKRQILSWELEQVIWNQKAQAHLIKKQGISSDISSTSRLSSVKKRKSLVHLGRNKQPSKGAIFDVTNDKHNQLNTSSEKWARVSYADALSKVPEVKVDSKKTTLQ